VSADIGSGSSVRPVVPSWPNRPVPQHHNLRSVSRPQEKFTPVSTADQSRSPARGCGVVAPPNPPPPES
jgi:hypothetical protein